MRLYSFLLMLALGLCVAGGMHEISAPPFERTPKWVWASLGYAIFMAVITIGGFLWEVIFRWHILREL